MNDEIEFADDSFLNEYYSELNLEIDSELEVLVQAYLRDAKYTSRSEATWNIVYSILNAGLVSLPLAASRDGFIAYLCVIFAACAITGYTACMNISLAHEQRVRTLEDLGQKAFGSVGLYLVTAWQLLLSVALM